MLATTEDAWGDIFRRANRQYTPPNLVLFSGGTQSACGFAQTAVGPFYCPNDSKVYLDTAFFRDMERKLGAPGEFARAYVIAHEVGHHVQNQLGILGKVDRERRGMGEAESNALQVRIELQADCFAGIWANRTEQMRRIIEPGDIEIRDGCRRRRRRRPAAAPRAGLCGAGELHPWQLRPAGTLVPHRARKRRHPAL